MIEDDDLLEDIMLFGIKSVLISKKNLIASLSVIKLFLKTKIKIYGDEVTDFYNKKIPKMVFYHTCLAVFWLDSALKKDDNYYLQVLLKECKYFEKKAVRHIIDKLGDFFLSIRLIKNKLECVKTFCKSIATYTYEIWQDGLTMSNSWKLF